MKILICAKDKVTKEKLIKECERCGHEYFLASNFAEVFLHADTHLDLFLCDITDCEIYVNYYLEFKKEKDLNIPYVVFICSHPCENVEVLTNTYIQSDDFELEYYLQFRKKYFFLSEQQMALQKMFRYLGLCSSLKGTFLLQEIFKYYYFNSYKIFLNFKDIYKEIAELHNMTENAVKKIVKRSIEIAEEQNGRGIREYKKKFKIKNLKIKMMVIYMNMIYKDFLQK